ncbi:MAG: cell division protein FtsL [Gammaproteobacteria bacterium]|nr:cell division protein FtsL [Gammaproteobacteria bacterium]
MERNISMLFLLAAVMFSAIAVVYVNQLERTLFVQLQAMQQQRDHLNLDWGRLQLEQSTWATHARIEGIARKQLGMSQPNFNEVVVIRP